MAETKLQIALDDITLEAAIKLLEDVAAYVDIIEAGTPFLLEYGMQAVRSIRSHFPDKEILCDAKIMDGGTIEAASALGAGADYVTVLGVADRATISAVAKEAHARKKQVVVDLLCMDRFEETIPVLESMGVDMLAVHVGVDQQQSGRTPLQDLIKLKSIVKTAKVAVAGGISLATLPRYMEHQPEVVIVGSAICRATDPLAEAMALHAQIQGGR